jgi:glycosyl transferase family 2
MVRLTAVVPATNRPPTLEACLDAIRAADAGPEQVIVISDPPLSGPAAARNAGAQAAEGDVLVFIDADVVVHRDAFCRIRAAFEADEELAAIFGSYDDEPAADGVVSSFRNLLHYHVHQISGGAASTFWGGLGAIRASVFGRAGGFNAARYPHPSIEDIELGMRIARSGGKILLDPEIQGRHLKLWTLSQMVQTDLIRRGIPWLRLLLETGESSRTLNLGPRHRMSTLAAVMIPFGLLTRRPRLAALSAISFVALNHSFYGLLVRKRGPREAAVGVGLHAIHHLTAAAAVPAAIVQHLVSQRSENACDPAPPQETTVLTS